MPATLWLSDLPLGNSAKLSSLAASGWFEAYFSHLRFIP